LTLYAAATTHFMLGLWALYQRRHFRYTVIEITQLVFGLSIPLLIASHFGIVRLGSLVFGRDPPIYAPALLAYWVARPYMVGVQFVLLSVAWIHACIGLYFWLRLKPFFKWAAPILLAIAVLLPPLAMTGTHRGAHEVTERAAQPQWRAEHIKLTPPAQRSVLDEITLFYFPVFYGIAIAMIFVARGRSSHGRESPWIDNGFLPRPAGTHTAWIKYSRGQPAVQGAACERLRRTRAMLDLPCSRRK
jgi:adenylate cyclase